MKTQVEAYKKNWEQFRHQYMMLGRYQADIEYFLGHGNRSTNQLFFKDPKEHIKQTIKQWKKLPIKPEWLRATELIEYKKQMLKDEN